MVAPPSERIRILIVDDEPGAREALSDIFDARGFDVVTAATGTEARAVLDQGFPDVALLDIRLPDEKGTDLLKEIRRRSDHTRCIMVTGYSDPADTITALNYGASAYIEKPLTDIGEVEATIHEVVDKYRETLRDRQRLHELDIIKDVGEAALSLDMDAMLQAVVNRVVTGFEADGGVVLLYDEADGHLHGAVQCDLSPEPIEQYVVAPGTGFTGRVFEQREVLGLESLSGAGIVLPQYLLHAGVTTILGAPIQSGKGSDHPDGVLVVAWRRRRAITTSDRDLLSVLAQRTALAIENARLYRRHIEAEQRAQFLAEVGRLFNSTLTVYDVVERVARKATERLGNGCAIFLKRPDSDLLDAVISFHTDPETEKTIEQRLRENPVRIGEGVVGQVAQSGEMMAVTADHIQYLYPDRPYLQQVGILTSLSVPLFARGDTIGVMSCSYSTPGKTYTPEDTELAQEFAARASVAIENAMLILEKEKRNQDLNSLFEMSTMVTQSMEVEAVLEGVLQGTMTVLEADACMVAHFSQDRRRVEVEAQRGLDRETALAFARAAVEAWPYELLRSEEPQVVKDLGHGVPESISDLSQRTGFIALCSVALEPEGEQQAALIALHKTVSGDLTSQRPLLKTLGGFAGVALANARSFERERRIAQELQESILPPELPAEMVGVEMANDYHPALQEANVGGDFYDVFELAPDVYGLVIGDVSGKGLSAAVHTAMVKYTLRAYSLHSTSPAEVLAQVNDAMCSLLPNDIFITLFYGVLDTRRRTLRYASAGHDSPLLCHASDDYEALESTGRALGLLAGANYGECTAPLMKDDAVLFYTDGITESRREGVFLEMEGVADLLRRHRNGSARAIVEGIYNDVRAYANGQMHDDIALLVIKVTGEDG